MDHARLALGHDVPDTRRRVGIEHLLTILSLSMEREPLRLAFLSLVTDDTHLRGTALEYLAVVLPEEVRDLLWPLVAEAVPPIPRASKQELATRLEDSRPMLTEHLDALRASMRASVPAPAASVAIPTETESEEP
jgi:hypothetical protein